MQSVINKRASAKYISNLLCDKRQKKFTTLKGIYINENKEYATFKIKKKKSGGLKDIFRP